MKLLAHMPKQLIRLRRLPAALQVRLRYFQHGRAPILTRHDDALAQALAPAEHDFKQLAFTFAIISLSAQLARIDGPLKVDEYLAFRAAFPLQGLICAKIRQLFKLACSDQANPELYIQQIKHLYPKNTSLHESLLARLFAIALADGDLQPKEERLLAKIAHQLGLSGASYSRIHEQAMYGAPPHDILGVAKRASLSDVKKRYRELMRRYHPDTYHMSDLSPELKAILSMKAVEVNQAYQRLSRA